MDPTLGEVVSTLFLEVIKSAGGSSSFNAGDMPLLERRLAYCPGAAALKLLLGDFLQNRFTGKRDQALPSPTPPLPKHSIVQWVPSPGSRPRERGAHWGRQQPQPEPRECLGQSSTGWYSSHF